MNKIGFWILIIIIVIGGIWFFTRSSSSDPTETSEPTSSAMPVIPTNPDEQPVVETEVIKEFTVSGHNFAFSPTTLAVQKGDTVKIIFKDTDGFHDLRVEGYNVGTTRLQTGGQAEVTFVAGKAGSFIYYCSVGTHRVHGMTGTFIVAE